MFKKFFSNVNYRNLFFALFGSAIVAFGTYNIHVNSNIPHGGIIGMCLIIEHYAGISPAISSLVINGFCYLLAWRLMGIKFVLSAGVATVGFSGFYAIFSAFPPVIPSMEDSPLLAAFLGAVLIEAGTGLTLRYGSAPNGEHALSLAFVRKGGLDFGWISFLKDFVVIILSFAYVQEVDAIVYALLIMTITTPLTDFIVTAPEASKITRRIPKQKNRWIPIISTGLIIVIVFLSVAVYLNDYSRADEDAINTYITENIENVEKREIDKDTTAFVPEGEVKSGFIFYPGGKVEHTAYEPLLQACAEKGIVCILIEMPHNLAVLGINKGIDATKHFPDVENWYIGGHSLGGSMAAVCASTNDSIFKGVVLLGAYSTSDITNLEVLSIYGNQDGVMNKNKYFRNVDNLPENYTEHVIIGGNHAYFGMYGEQSGDNTATISNIEQINLTAQYISDFILK